MGFGIDQVLGTSVENLEGTNIYYTTSLKGECSTVISYLRSRGIEVSGLLNNNDPFATIVDSLDPTSRTAVFTDDSVIMYALPHLYNLEGFAVLIHVDLRYQEYSLLPALRDLRYPLLISNDLGRVVKAVDEAVEIAFTLNQPVFHFYNSKAIGQDTIENYEPVYRALNFEESSRNIADILRPSLDVLYGPNPDTLILNLSPYGKQFADNLTDEIALYDITVYKPFDITSLLSNLPPSVTNISVVQGSSNASTNKGMEPILLDVVADFNVLLEKNICNVVTVNVGTLTDISAALSEITSNAKSEQPNQSLFISENEQFKETLDLKDSINKAISLEKAYIDVLEQLFTSNLSILNQFKESKSRPLNPEYAFGGFLREQWEREQLLSTISARLDTSLFDYDSSRLVELLSKWISYNKISLDESKLSEANAVASELFDLLQKNSGSFSAKEILDVAPTEDLFLFHVNWLIGSDAWAYDLGNSGVHHALASQKNVNILLVDSEPSEKVAKSTRRKKDVGLYAMNFGNVYVASVAVYSSYTQLLTAFLEAAKYNGPSIVLAYLPYSSEDDTPLEVLKETKKAVETGYWPLYRYNPSEQNDEDVFKLDSSIIRRQLQQFLDRENRFTMLCKKIPELAGNLEKSASELITIKQKRRAKEAYGQLLEGLSGPPLNIYYASDGGNAAGLAKLLGARASARGLKSTVLSMENVVLDELPGETNVIFIVSTTGQGEFPQDGKSFWEGLKSSIDLDLASVNYAVFGLGDSHYWPRKEDERYYNKPSKDLFAKLHSLSAKSIIPLGLGDDQDEDGYRTQYKEWEAKLWEAFGISNAAVGEDPQPLTNEDMKLASNYLRGTIAESLIDTSTGAVSASDQQLTKFHGIYLQDERDIRDVRKMQGLEPYYIFMVRTRLAGGVANPDQYLILDRMADTTGNGTIKITTRATFQLHGILKKDLKHTIRSLNSTLMDTLGACGDLNRNVMISALPHNAKLHKSVSNIAALISDRLLPQTTAYHEIWLEGPDDRDGDSSWSSIWNTATSGPKKKILVGGNALQDVEPIYGPTYLPRKFKINIATPPYNDVDVWSCDLGMIAISGENSEVEGFNLYVGGGMGTTHNNKKTYPRIGSSFGFVPVDEVYNVIEKIVLLQRDHGDRKNRKHARLKYTIDDMGVDVFKGRVEELCGIKFAPERPYTIESNIDYFGWVKDETGLNHFTAFIENGRIEDSPSFPHKTGLRKIAEYMKETNSGEFRLTGNQHIVISSIKDQHLDDIKAFLKRYKLDNYDFSGLRLASSACVALPTCGLAMAESERYLPLLITKLEEALEGYGLRHDSIVMRMSGCPNGCSRPWLAEVACVGKAMGTYNLLLGGGYYGQRINKLYRSSLKEDEIIGTLKPLFKRWSLEREEGEHFGDFVIRVGIIKPTLEGKYFHDDLPEGAL
ncbi:sulfite reductase (NADPH) subunit beta Ecym_5152 [Eremothecium cymbalariae DBVPG|uniref:Sulfite reductase [NADPH] subunit beta n=1 Tax=Eremothecium cymbalariae (strain CBS 270.75 / DBVPG 7215 / KCTC 17166 / NRRL Y-17582) TaxID=931890 RepID=I6NCY6_ERECY|nr:hypothetical protein Ecym_5152 [Eremothecium cymbalariae DBVPG\